MSRLKEGDRIASILIPTEPLEIPNLENEEVRIPEFIPYTEFESLRRHIVFSAPFDVKRRPQSFQKHLGILLKEKKLSQRTLAKDAGVDHSTISRLSASNREPKLSTLSSIFRTIYFNDDSIYQIIMDSVPANLTKDSFRSVFSEDAPVLTGTPYQQLIGYRKARDISQRLMAIRASINHSSVSLLENTERVPHLSIFASITFVLGLNPTQIGYVARSF